MTDTGGRLIVLSGVMASGKSTVAQLLAERFEPSVHVHGDVFRRWVVRGDREPRPPLDAAMVAQLRLRYRAALGAAQTYAAGGFTAVLQDTVVGPLLAELVASIDVRPAHLVVLDPDPATVAAREAGRAKTGYAGGWTPARLVHALRSDTPRLGLWVDSTRLTPVQTAEHILSRLDEARIGPGDQRCAV